MNVKKLKALANELAKNFITPEDLSVLMTLLKKTTIETALNAELEKHLSYTKYAQKAVVQTIAATAKH